MVGVCFLAVSPGFTLLLLRSQLYFGGSPFLFFFYVLSYVSGVRHSSPSSAFSAISLGFTILGEMFAYVFFNPTMEVMYGVCWVFLLPAFTRL